MADIALEAVAQHGSEMRVDVICTFLDSLVLQHLREVFA